MKLTIQSLLVLGVIFGTTLAAPVDEDLDSDGPLLTHTEHGASTEDPGFNATLEDIEAQRHAKKCITFTSENPNWRYNANDGPGNPWHGVGSGSFGNGPKTLCFPRTRKNGAGGALYVGTEQRPLGGNTKIECFFPFSGKGNCDVSLVDGYSLSATCKVEGHENHNIGGPKNLWNTNKPCPDRSEINRNICKNDFAAEPHTLSDVKPFFKEGISDGNHYCVIWDCKNFPISMDKKITCHISGGRH